MPWRQLRYAADSMQRRPSASGRSSDWSVSFFGGLGGYGVAHYLPLDGTVFHDSRSVDSEPFVGTGSFGICARRGAWVSSSPPTFFTKAFATERQNMDFGTLGISRQF